jgi:hypothetical protein
VSNWRYGATFSPCRSWRYSLSRRWDDDPTIRRCISFAQRWGLGGLVMTNIFAFRSTDPSRLARIAEPHAIGPENDETLRSVAKMAGKVVAAWGVHGTLYGRERAVLSLLDDVPLLCFGTTKNGHPRHPLYIRGDVLPTPLEATA